jgi:hypothetical membrane protein
MAMNVLGIEAAAMASGRGCAPCHFYPSLRELFMRRRGLENWFSLFGLVAFVFYFLHVFVGQANYPGYDWMRQAVSDLTAADSASYMVASRFSSLYGLFSCLGTLFLCLVVRGRFNKVMRIGMYLYALMNFVSNVGYTLFPLSGSGFQGGFTDIMHLYVVTFGVVMLSIVSLVLIGVGGLKKNGNRVISILGFAALLLMFVGSIGMNVVAKDHFGILERFSVFSVVAYTCILGVFGFVIGAEGE